MRKFYDDFLIDDKPILVPDAGVELKLTDLDAQDSGRDESGVMHRIVLRKGVRTWEFAYSALTVEEYRYMLSLFENKAQFKVRFRNVFGKEACAYAYNSNHSILLYDLRRGICKNLKFTIIEC